MRRRYLLVVVILTGCVGGPVRMRPGSNVALPAQRSIVHDLVNGYVCSKDGSRPDETLRDVQRCGPLALDTIKAHPTPRRDSIP